MPAAVAAGTGHGGPDRTMNTAPAISAAATAPMATHRALPWVQRPGRSLSLLAMTSATSSNVIAGSCSRCGRR